MPELRVAFIISPGTCPPDFGGAQLLLHGTFLRLWQIAHARSRAQEPLWSEIAVLRQDLLPAVMLGG